MWQKRTYYFRIVIIFIQIVKTASGLRSLKEIKFYRCLVLVRYIIDYSTARCLKVSYSYCRNRKMTYQLNVWKKT